MGRDGAMLTP